MPLPKSGSCGARRVTPTKPIAATSIFVSARTVSTAPKAEVAEDPTVAKFPVKSLIIRISAQRLRLKPDVYAEFRVGDKENLLNSLLFEIDHRNQMASFVFGMISRRA